ncbi:hypothetical protein CWC02_00820 [Pseudoalteromonas sp. S2721]|uniref:hypothetical protein n=1 Tax=Pseudoalteromonas sp. S2721 TaxID=579526 RepID=UPI00110B7F24|nr:hypothetical protein [Pseudoalteromonas sp. S2721]TMP21706.1 hypothetical protein CWC02_00820 [Pseudoalteromonas sp. S2721]
MLKKVFFIIFIILQCSCSIRSNFGDYVIADVENRGRGEHVQVYKDREIFNFRTSYLGNVESNYCHEKNDSLIPESAYYYNPSNIKESLQDSLKVKAHKMGGNGIVFSQCYTRSNTNQCYKSMRCEGSVYNIEN